MREIGDRIGITEPAAQRIVAEAATTGYITRQRNGPRNQYGGWGVDALLGEQTRSHDDLDLVIARRDCSAAQDALAPLGSEHATDIEPGLPARLALRDSSDRRVDLGSREVSYGKPGLGGRGAARMGRRGA